MPPQSKPDIRKPVEIPVGEDQTRASAKRPFGVNQITRYNDRENAVDARYERKRKKGRGRKRS